MCLDPTIGAEGEGPWQGIRRPGSSEVFNRGVVAVEGPAHDSKHEP